MIIAASERKRTAGLRALLNVVLFFAIKKVYTHRPAVSRKA
jgi:hypothetical protein